MRVAQLFPILTKPKAAPSFALFAKGGFDTNGTPHPPAPPHRIHLPYKCQGTALAVP